MKASVTASGSFGVIHGAGRNKDVLICLEIVKKGTKIQDPAHLDQELPSQETLPRIFRVERFIGI
jgi:hypothetical protein